MKKLISILLVCYTLVLSAQTNVVSRFKGVTGNGTTDSLTTLILTTGADTMLLQSQHWASTVSIQTVITRASGNTLGTKITLQGSFDGTHWNQCADSSVLTNAATSVKTWVLHDNPFAYYRTLVTDSGAQKIYIKTYFLPNKQSGLTKGTSSFKSASYPTLTRDTVTNSGSNSLKLQVQQWYETMSVQLSVTKISGTVGGTISLQGSNDNVNFVNVPTTYMVNTVGATAYGLNVYGGSATRTASNGSASYFFVVKESPYAYYRIFWTGTGTMSASMSANLLPNK